jgi:hypothetical protein
VRGAGRPGGGGGSGIACPSWGAVEGAGCCGDAPAGGGPQHPSLIASSWEEFGWDLLRVALRRFRG